MTSGFGIMDMILTLYLSEGMMIFTVVLLIASLIVFLKSKGKSLLRKVCAVLFIYSMLYLGTIFTISYLFGSPHEPASPAVADVDYIVSEQI